MEEEFEQQKIVIASKKQDDVALAILREKKNELYLQLRELARESGEIDRQIRMLESQEEEYLV